MKIYAETKVINVKPLGATDGSLGYEVHTKGLGPKELTSKGIIFSASSLGTQDLLFRLKQSGSLPHISNALGKKVRTNAESLIGIRYPGSKIDLSKGIAIGCGVHIDENTHIEVCRYPDGSDSMGLLSTHL